MGTAPSGRPPARRRHHDVRAHAPERAGYAWLRRRHDRLQREHEETARVVARLRNEATARDVVARHDLLTGLANRAELQRRLEHALGAGRRCAVLLMDLDRFKEVNDTLGHLAGDTLLQEVARRVLHRIAPTATAARFGGDEFAVLLPALRDDADAQECACAIRGALEFPIEVGDATIEIQSSIGIALAPDDGTDVATLLHSADVAMYAAKRAASGVQRYDPTHDPHSQERRAFAGALRTAIASDDIVVHYQPIARFDGTIVRAEALARWQHDELGLIAPSEFIVGAERSGLIGRLSESVLERALDDIESWQADGLELDVAVNVAAANLVDVEFPDRLAAMLERHAVAAGRLTLELTESSVLSLSRARAVINAVHELGVRLCIDDLGRGPSSLTLLHTLPLCEVKIDRQVVCTLGASLAPARVPARADARVDSCVDARVVGALVGAAHALGLTVVAEGVEGPVVWRAARALGCDAAQGYWLSHPRPATDFACWLAARREELPSRGAGRDDAHRAPSRRD